MPAMTETTSDRIIAHLKKTAIFSQLPDDDLQVMAQYAGFVDYRKGEVIFEKGSKSKQLFIIDRGEVAINSTLDTDRLGQAPSGDQAIARFIGGEIFGEFEFFEGDTRTAFASAAEDTTILVFPREGVNLDHLFDEYAHIFVKIYHTLITVNSSRQRLTHRLISEKTGWIEELKKQMFFDKLTGVYNRTYLEDELARNFAFLGPVFSLLVVKPDNFKLINDTFGHEAGDGALQAISSKLQSLLRDADFAVRYRGNEFIVVFPSTPLDEAEKIAGVFLREMTAFDIGIAMKRESLFQTFSIGVATYPEHERAFLELVEKAFTKVFEQREKGGNGVRVASAVEDELYNFLKTVGMLSSLKMSELHQFSQHLELLRFPAGAFICRQLDPGDELFIIKSGVTSVSISVQDGTEKELTQLKSGEFFGEMAIFENAPRSANCVALEDCEILRMNKEDFFTLMRTYPHTAINVMKSMLNKTTDRLNASGQFITQMVKWGEDASLRAVTDKLTGVFNRRYLESELEKRFTMAQKEGAPLSLVMADMDFFREVNEGYSHEVGDRYIVEVAKVFTTTFRKTDIVSRYGGDEFTILLPNTDLETAMAVTEDVRRAVERLDFLKELEGPDLHLSVSLGVSCFPATARTQAELTEQADKALYAAKKGGRNRVEHFAIRGPES
ncbi:MAG TPA: diguanylate cyclase [Spirochaetota bacterium]|nr:diguanylate cyclase [Spirochaetota bacterium]HNT12817.1 diguanylate cyclase [Spirochaetota bacterium]